MPRAYTTSWVDYPDWPDRMLDRIIVMENGCWLLDHRGRQGFAPSVRQILKPPDAPANMAYKIIYEFFYGPLGESVDLYCGCGDTFCVKPGHRIALTRREMQRINVWRHFGYDTEQCCSQGHERWEFGYRHPSGRLRCRACETAKRRAHREANPEMQRAYDRSRARRRAGWPTET